MICPFCAAVVEDSKIHMNWHRAVGVYPLGIGITSIPKNAALLGEPEIVCYTCGEPATWDNNEDRCCDYHIFESDGYID